MPIPVDLRALWDQRSRDSKNNQFRELGRGMSQVETQKQKLQFSALEVVVEDTEAKRSA